MSNYSYYYVKVVADGNQNPKAYKFLRGNPALFEPPEDTWTTLGRYNLLSRSLRGGLSGSGDVHHPANVVFKEEFFPAESWSEAKSSIKFYAREDDVYDLFGTLSNFGIRRDSKNIRGLLQRLQYILKKANLQ